MCAKSLFQVQSQKGQTGNKSLVSKDGGFTCEKEAFVEAASCFLADKAHLLLQEITPCIRSHSPAHSHVHLFFHFPSTPLLFIHIYFCNSLPLKHSLHCIFFLLALIFFFFFLLPLISSPRSSSVFSQSAQAPAAPYRHSALCYNALKWPVLEITLPSVRLQPLGLDC